jgi:hypothetical protein
MTHDVKVGDHVRWNLEAGHVSGPLIKVHTRDTQYKGHARHCTEDDPQYEVSGDRSDHVAMQGLGAAQGRLGDTWGPTPLFCQSCAFAGCGALGSTAR